VNVHHPARTCALCEAAPPIENSHIVPNFVIKHLKRGTPVKALIHSTAPTDFEQDAWKGPYLCEGCEQAVSRLESYFARSVYTPLLSSGLVSLRYDDRLSRFLASVHFRYLTFVAHRSHEPLPGQLERLRQDLRSAISGGLAAAPRVALYLVPLYPVRTTVYPPGANHYFFEAIDGAQFTWHRADRSAQWISYVKFPNLALFAAEESLDRAFADPALVAGHGIADAGEFSYAPATDPPAILELVRDRIERIPAKVQANYGRLSERQAASLQGQIDRHPGAASMRAGTTHQLDLDLLRAWQRERGQP
jgi:hypothetical protein